MREAAGIEPRLDSRDKIGELTIWVDEKLVIQKGFFRFADFKDVLAAVQQAL